MADPTDGPQPEPLRMHDLFIVREAVKEAVRQRIVKPAHRERLAEIAEHTLLRAYLAMEEEDQLTMEIVRKR